MPVANQPPFEFAVSSLEQRASQGASEHTGMEGGNDGGYEQRVTQEV